MAALQQPTDAPMQGALVQQPTGAPMQQPTGVPTQQPQPSGNHLQQPTDAPHLVQGANNQDEQVPYMPADQVESWYRVLMGDSVSEQAVVSAAQQLMHNTMLLGKFRVCPRTGEYLYHVETPNFTGPDATAHLDPTSYHYEERLAVYLDSDDEAFEDRNNEDDDRADSSDSGMDDVDL